MTARGGGAPGRGDRAIDACTVLLLPFVQLGVSYYAAVATLLAAMIVGRQRRAMVAGWRAAWPWLLCVPAMALSLLDQTGDDPAQDVLRIAREALCFALLLLIVRGTALRPAVGDWPRLRRPVALLVAGLLLLCVVQAAALRGGVYLGFPVEAYAQGANTIPTALALRYSALRPAATLAEPSYLAFILLSLMLPVAAATRWPRRDAVLVALGAGAGLLSQSAGFVLCGGLVAFVAVARGASFPGKAALLPAILFGALLLATVAGDVGLVARLGGGMGRSADASFFVRIVGPLQVLPRFLGEHPLGLPFSLLEGEIRPDAARLGIDPAQYLMNGLFNLLFEFGVVGLALVAALLSVRDGVVRAYLLAAMTFNGAFLAPDKLAVMGFAIGLYQVARRREPARAWPRPRSFARPSPGVA